jgi:hypothetical protein
MVKVAANEGGREKEREGGSVRVAWVIKKILKQLHSSTVQ